MVGYLSDEWLDRAGEAIAGSDALAAASADLDLTIAYEITGAPTGKCQYAIRLDEGSASLERSAVADAPVSFQLDYDTAAAIAQGELSAQAAFMQGRIKLGGDVMVLIRDAAALDGIDDALADLRADTEF